MTAPAESTRSGLRSACVLALACVCMLVHGESAAADIAGDMAGYVGGSVAGGTVGSPARRATVSPGQSPGMTGSDWGPDEGVHARNYLDAPWQKPSRDTVRDGGVYPDVPLVPCDAVGLPDAQGRTFSCYGDQSAQGRANDAPTRQSGERAARPGSLTRLQPFKH